MVNEDRFEMKNRYYIFITLLTLMCMSSCQKEELYTGPCDVRVRLMAQEEVNVTRAYKPISSATPAFEAELFVTNGTLANSTTMTWDGSTTTTNLKLEEGDYYMYGYLPKRDGATFDKDTRVMSIPQIAGLGTTDIMVLRKGTVLSIEKDDKNVEATLLMDHRMAKVTPRFYIDSEYAKIRSIRIKKVEFSMDGASSYTAQVKYDNSTSPISYTLAWTPEATGNLTALAYENESPTENLQVGKANALACGECYVCPEQAVTDLQMTVTYDVYDTKGQLVRPDDEATNKMKIKVSGITLAKLEAGKNYILNIRIVPTYLYVLSDNDEESVLTIND